MSACREFPMNISGRTARRARSGPGFSMPSPTLTPGDIERRFGSADRHLREAGVTYRAPGETADRLWPLSHLPLLIDEAEWQQLTAGIVQRAQLLELVLSDLYGEGRLVAEGAIPAAAIAGSTEYLRAVCGIKPPGGRYLNLYAADVGRGPDGRWWVLGDRTQAPSGAGYALENRLVLSRAFATLYKSMNVERVAPFFEAFRDCLRASADRDEPRIGLLTPGAVQRNLFRARHAGALSRLPAGRGRRSRRQRRPHSYPHRRRPEAARRAAAPGRFQFARSAGARRLLAARRARPDRCAAQERRRRRQHAGLRRDGGARAARLPAQPEPAFLRRRSEDAAHRDLVVRPEVRARGSAVAARRGRDRGRLSPGRSRFSGQRAGARQRVVGERARTAQDGDQRSRHRLCRPGTGAAVDHAGVGPGADHAAPVRAAGVRRRDARRLDHHARRLLPDRRSARCPRRVDGRRRAGGGRLGGLRQGGIDRRRCCRRCDTVRIRRIAGWVPSRAADNLFWLGRYLERAEATLRLVRALGTRSAIPARDRQPCFTRWSESSGFW